MVQAPPPSPPRPNTPKPRPRGPGQRRNFHAEAMRAPHKFPIGVRVFMRSNHVRTLIGPLYVVEYCEHLYPQGPPQYILQPTFGPTQDVSKFAICDESMMIECKEDEPPVDIPNTEAFLLWHWLSEKDLTN